MEWAEWAPVYDAILRDLGYDRKADEAARDVLDELLEDKLRADLPPLQGEVAILGPATYDGSRASRVSRASDPSAHSASPLIVADPRDAPPARPFAVVTDLDGDVALQLAMNAMGVPLVV